MLLGVRPLDALLELQLVVDAAVARVHQRDLFRRRRADHHRGEVDVGTVGLRTKTPPHSVKHVTTIRVVNKRLQQPVRNGEIGLL